jgi:hypothetical protein
VDVSLLTLGDLITDPITGERMTVAERHRCAVDQAVAAEAAGLRAIYIGGAAPEFLDDFDLDALMGPGGTVGGGSPGKSSIVSGACPSCSVSTPLSCSSIWVASPRRSRST